MDDITEDVAKLRTLAQHIDPNSATVLSPAELTVLREDLLRIAVHLDRIATGGDATAP